MGSAAILFGESVSNHRRIMAHSYTPGLRVARLTRIVKERWLPLKGDVIVNIGDRVSAEQVVARTELPGNVHPVNCAGQLGILPADIHEALVLQPGSEIKKGETIAMSKSFFGLFKSTLPSPIPASIFIGLSLSPIPSHISVLYSLSSFIINLSFSSYIRIVILSRLSNSISSCSSSSRLGSI